MTSVMSKTRVSRVRNTLIILVGLLAASPTRADYSFTTFDVPGSLSTTVEGINDSGVAVGTYTTPTSGGLPASHGFILDPGGNLSTYDVPNSSLTYARGISNQGKVVGYYTSNTDPTSFHGYIRDAAGGFSFFDAPNSSSTLINGVNQSGQLVGTYIDGSGTHGFLRSADGSFRAINAPGGILTNVLGINASGTMVGYYAATDLFGQFGYHGFVLDSGGTFRSLDAALPFSTQTFAEGINDLGEVVGNTILFGAFSVGFVLNPDLSLQSIVAAPNGLTTVVEDINNCGQLVGNYTDFSQETHGFITPNTCPEPSSLIMASVGLLIVPILRRRMRTALKPSIRG